MYILFGFWSISIISSSKTNNFLFQWKKCRNIIKTDDTHTHPLKFIRFASHWPPSDDRENDYTNWMCVNLRQNEKKTLHLHFNKASTHSMLNHYYIWYIVTLITIHHTHQSRIVLTKTHTRNVYCKVKQTDIVPSSLHIIIYIYTYKLHSSECTCLAINTGNKIDESGSPESH